MNSLSRFGLLIALSFSLCIVSAGCGDDDGATGGGTIDTTPPTVVDVLSLDANHVMVTFDEAVTRASAQRPDNYTIVELAVGAANVSGADRPPAQAPAVEIAIATAVLVDDTRALLTTWDSMTNTPYNLLVRRVSDVSGNVMTGESSQEFTGESAPDTQRPFVAARTPAIGATGIGTSQPVVVTFSEPMIEYTVYAAFTWTFPGGLVTVAMQKLDETSYVFVPLVPLDANTIFSVSLGSAGQDWAGNPLTATSWTFRTTGTPDTTRPELLSSVPPDSAWDVSTTTAIELRFSEPIDPTSLEKALITPVPSSGTEEWIDGGRTVRFTPDEPLLPDTQYMLVIPSGFLRDLSGNTNEDFYTVRFTTGSSFAAGAIEGSVTGDPYSVAADDPTGAIVVATTIEMFGPDGDIDLLGLALVEADDTYEILRLPDQRYYPFAVLDSNGDGVPDPERGDAIGAYGADIRAGDFTQSPVYIENGSALLDVDFKLYDPEAIAGKVVYDGQTYRAELTSYSFLVGVFDVLNFDPENLTNPSAATDGGPLGWDPEYVINTIDQGLDPGTYYVGCYLDVNSTQSYEPDVDPVGFYRNLETDVLYPVTVQNGTDALNVIIHIDDPATGAPAGTAVAWRGTDSKGAERPSLKVLSRRIRNALNRNERPVR